MSNVELITAGLLLLGIGAAFLVARLGSRFRTLALRLDENEARFRQITENLSAVVWLSDPDFRRTLYVNRAYERPVVLDGAIVVRRMMNLSSSFDHRFVDGYDAAAMIQALKELLEHPAAIFIGA